MSTIQLQTIKFPGLNDTYTIPSAPEDIGAAPAGYGLGSNDPTVLRTISEIDAFGKSGWARVALSGTEHIEGTQDATLMVSAGQRHIKQTLLSHFSLYGGYYELVRVCEENDWKPWEWVNPPMIAGVEYRTTERYNGKPVFSKTISYGSLSATPGRVEVGIGTSGVMDVVSIEGVLRANPFGQYDFVQPLPLFATDTFSGVTSVAFVFLNYREGAPSVILQSSIDLSAYICTVTVRYTKS